MENKLREKGYIVSNIKLEVNLEENNETYGRIENIELNISRNVNEDNNENEKNERAVNKIKIGEQINSTIKKELTEEEEREIKMFISEEYGINNKQISIR